MTTDVESRITIAGTVYKLAAEGRQPLVGAFVRAESDQNGEHVVIEQQSVADGKYTLTNLWPGRWRLTARSNGYRSSEAIVTDFMQNVSDQEFILLPAVRVSGTVYWSGSTERVAGAVIKAMNDKGKVQFAVTNEDGDFTFTDLELGPWTFVVMSEESHPLAPAVHDLRTDQTNLHFALFRLEGTVDEQVGKRFFYTLLWVLGGLLLIYVVLHWWFPPTAATAAGTAAPGYFWSREPAKFLEVFLWGLAGALVSKIIEVGGYLRWRKFYQEGMVLHVAHIVTVPLLALVTAMLLAQIEFTFALEGGSNLTLNLSQPNMLVALSFIIGTVPWKIWGFIQSTAAQVTARLQLPAPETAKPKGV